jgi:hypothetical protein
MGGNGRRRRIRKGKKKASKKGSLVSFPPELGDKTPSGTNVLEL